MNYLVVNNKKLTGSMFSIALYMKSHLAVVMFAK